MGEVPGAVWTLSDIGKSLSGFKGGTDSVPLLLSLMAAEHKGGLPRL